MTGSVAEPVAAGARMYLPDDWYPGGIPSNVVLGRDVYLDSSYGFAAFASEQMPGLTLGDACGAYDRATFVVGPRGRVTVGAYTVLNGTYVICNERVTIGAHCLLSWGVVITDSWPGRDTPALARRAALRAAAADPLRRLPPVNMPRPVVLEDNVWVGFGAVILPGVTLGRGCIIGCKAIVERDVSPYAVVVGDPYRMVRVLEPDDTPDVRAAALRECARAEAQHTDPEP
ncbi:MAG: acyltransferase [Gemmatimonadaceae bacterium]